MEDARIRAARPLIVLVEDCKILVKFYEQMFNSVKELSSYRLAAFENAWSALEFLNHLPSCEAPAAVVLDWTMEGMSGIDMLTTLRKDPQFVQVPVLMVTAKMSRLEVAEALAKGANDYLVKPINTKALTQKLLRLVAPPTAAPRLT